MTSRFSTVTWFILFAAAGFALHLVKYRVQDIRDDVTSIANELNKENESLVLLQAEWSYLNRPDRLRKLANKFLSVKIPNAYDIADVGALPMKGQPFIRVDHRQAQAQQAEAIHEIEMISGER